MTAGFDYRPASWLLMAYATDVQQAWMTSNLKTDNDVWRTTWLHALSGRATWQRLSLTARVVASFIYNGNADASARARNARRITPWLMADGRPLTNATRGSTCAPITRRHSGRPRLRNVTTTTTARRKSSPNGRDSSDWVLHATCAPRNR